MRILFITILLVAAVPAAAPAQLYQYTDKNGNTVYTDKQPLDVESKQTKLREGGVYRSSERQETALPDPEKVFQPKKKKSAEEPKKNYNRVSVAMYMTDW